MFINSRGLQAMLPLAPGKVRSQHLARLRATVGTNTDRVVRQSAAAAGTATPRFAVPLPNSVCGHAPHEATETNDDTNDLLRSDLLVRGRGGLSDNDADDEHHRSSGHVVSPMT